MVKNVAKLSNGFDCFCYVGELPEIYNLESANCVSTNLIK